MGVCDMACFRMVFQAAVVEELEVDGPTKGPLRGMIRMEEGFKRSSWEGWSDGGVTEGGVVSESVGEEGGDGEVDERGGEGVEKVAS